ncbi:L,D-transpeptidase [Candidatus Falkowbacteria bacterium]|nr:L,D-transpeptidase [Candidatus Falkowbacteria bacterium]
MFGFKAVQADSSLDSDHDKVSDQDEILVYHTDPQNADTDNDGFTDGDELKNGYSPYDGKKALRLEDGDADKDGLSDRMELNFRSNPVAVDTDGDGFGDNEEVKNGFDPTKPNEKLAKRIEVNLAKQELAYFLGSVRLGTSTVSTGRPSMPTPKGTFKIANKNRRAWSKSYGLWMPYWMGISGGRVGFHELPEWPNGYKEGANHLGKPVSHGCIRLGVGPAEKLYKWAEVGTAVIIY